MCGIAGYLGLSDHGIIEAMVGLLAHRGPDGKGFHRDTNVALGHARLSIIDVAGGRQPILNEDESLAVVCNGEIYNHLELRRDLEAQGHRFRTHSDTEVILHLYEDHGVRAIDRLFGMFVFALHDRQRNELYIGRDRFGVKPLSYVQMPGVFAFASESKAFDAVPGLSRTLDPGAVHDYLALRYVPGPGGLWREMRKFPAAHWGIVRADGTLETSRYWSPELYDGPWLASDAEYLEGFAERFETSIRRRLMSEVPLGAYLSGGLDSGTIVAAMAREMKRPVRTYSVGFDFEFDELAGAAVTAKHTGSIHTEVKCRPADIAYLPKIIRHLDEPVGDPIVIPMYLLSKAAKESLTVILAGEGADEILGGYLFHKALLKGCRLARLVPRWLRNTLVTGLIGITPPHLLDLAFQYPARLGERGKQKIVDFIGLLGPERIPAAWRHLISLFDERDVRGLYTEDFRRAVLASRGVPVHEPRRGAPDLNRIIDLQFDHWLPDDILTKQDKLSMANGIEGREPFLDHELVEYALRLPPHLKIDGGTTKVILRRYAERLLPPEVTKRKKMPFYAPMERFVADSTFRDMVGDCLSERAVRERGLFEPKAVGALLELMEKGEDFLYAKQVFALLALELWFRGAKRGV